MLVLLAGSSDCRRAVILRKFHVFVVDMSCYVVGLSRVETRLLLFRTPEKGYI